MAREMRMPSPSQHSFAQVPQNKHPRSVFDRSKAYKTTFDCDYLIPMFVDEVLPGDSIAMEAHGYIRMLSPLKVPIMDNLHADVFWFFVPNRLIWDNWERFQGAQRNPGDSVSFNVPQMDAGGAIAIGSLADYMGLPTGISAFAFNTLHFRAYNLIWNEWFRDQNLQQSVVVDVDDGPDTYSDYVLLKRGKRHDYFTGCLPSPQRGTAVSLPLGTSAIVMTDTAHDAVQKLAIWSTAATAGYFEIDSSAAKLTVSTASGTAGNKMYADLSTATAATINQLRQAFQVQRLLERDQRSGTRYVEALKARWGVTSPDARLQRPEYLGGGSTPIFVSPVAQTTASPASPTQLDAAGRLSGSGTGVFNGRKNGFVKSFVEHGVIIGLVEVRADLTYQQGLHRMWSRRTRYDFFEPVFSGLGEQAVLSQEIWMNGTPAQDTAVFGYQEYGAEYRYGQSQVTGLFRSDAVGTLDLWHLAQDFATRPTLNATFIVDTAPVDRVIAVPAEPQFILDAYFKTRWARAMPVYGVPGLIDHF